MSSDLDVKPFAAAARAVGIELSGGQDRRLRQAALWIAQLGRTSGISGYDAPQSALMRGMAPALAYFALDTPREGLVADLGAGNGALGAALAILSENLSIHLVDRAQRAYTACEILSARLGLPNLLALRMDADDLQAGSYDAVAFRAFAPGPSALLVARRLVRASGCLIAYHRPDDTSFTAPEGPLSAIGTALTTVPGLVATAYRV